MAEAWTAEECPAEGVLAGAATDDEHVQTVVLHRASHWTIVNQQMPPADPLPGPGRPVWGGFLSQQPLIVFAPVVDPDVMAIGRGLKRDGCDLESE